jgi:hypothetical protein
MALSQAFLIALFISAIVFDKIVVDANIAKSMYINWRNNEAAIVGSDDLQLALDQTSGKKSLLLLSSTYYLINFEFNFSC